jgi:hypothetical protein
MKLSLPLTTMEEFLYWEDRPAYPWSCFVRLRFSGRLDRTAFEAAVRTVVARHPLFTAIVETDRRGRLRWAAVDNPSPKIEWETAPTGGPIPTGTHLDLRQEIGLRFHVRTDETNTDVTMQFHHVCCDGAGFSLFVKEFLVAYALAYGNAPKRACLADLDPGKLVDRGRFGLTFWKLLQMMPKQLAGLLGARQFLMRVPTPLVPHRVAANDAPLPKEYPAMVHHLFDRDTTTKIRMESVRQGVTYNDLLARDLFMAISEWRTRHNIEDDGGWLRMMIPMNIRSSDDRQMPAANIISSVFLDRRKPDFADPDQLLRGIHEEMDLIKRLRLGYTFVFSTAIIRRLFGGLKKQVLADKCSISCIFTNIGTILAHVPLPRHDDNIVAGNVRLNDLDIVVPVRPYSCVTAAVAMYAHKLGVTLHYDPRPMSEQQANDLLDIFVRRIRESVAACDSDGHGAAVSQVEQDD